MTAVPAGVYALGPPEGQLLVKVFREGVASRMGHDLVFEVRRWNAKVLVDSSDLSLSTLEATAEIGSFTIVEASGGAKPLTRSDHADIRRNLEEKVLDARRFPTASFRSTAVSSAANPGATISGELTIAGTTRPVDIALALSGERARATMTVVQSQWGIKPFSAFMGALKVRDAVDIVLDVPLPAAG